MNAVVIQDARFDTFGRDVYGNPRLNAYPAIVRFGGISWTSDTPRNFGDAATANRDAARFVTLLNSTP
jgi:hypothetical protein